MKTADRRLVVICALLVVASIGCSTTKATSEQGTADSAEESVEGVEDSEGESPESEGEQSNDGTILESTAVGVPDGFETPERCPDIVNISLSEEKKGQQELHEWFCGRFDESGTPTYEEPDEYIFGGACTLEEIVRQEATRKVAREVTCFDDDGRELAKLITRDGEVSSVRTHEYDGGDDPTTTVAGNSKRCSITRRKGNTEVIFSSQKGGGLQAMSRTEYDDQGRVANRIKHRPGGDLVVEEHEYQSTDEMTSETVLEDGQKKRETVEFLRDDGSVERKVERTFTNGELTMAMETTFDEQGRVVRKGPPEGVDQKFATVGTYEYRGEAEHPVVYEVVALQDGAEKGSVTVTYELDGEGRSVSSKVAYSTGETLEESWVYKDGRLVEKHVVEMVAPGQARRGKTHYEIRYDDQGRPVFQHRWKGDKDSRSYRSWKTTATYECMK